MSYLVDIQLDSAATSLNPQLNLQLRKGRFYLTTANAVYSYGDLYSNFLETFKRLDFSKFKPCKVLVLGFGMGSVPFMLERVFKRKFHCVGVEADAKIAEWVERYVLPSLNNEVELHHADALVFVEKCRDVFDLVVVDIFLDDLVPSQFESPKFLSDCKKLLAPNGLILFNRLADTVEVMAASSAFFEQTFKAVFPEGEYLEVDGNWVLSNRKLS